MVSWHADDMIGSLHKYVTTDPDENDAYECFVCNQHCRSKQCDQRTCNLVQRSIQRCVESEVAKRMPDYVQKSKACGEDGIAFVFQNDRSDRRVVKAVLFPNDVDFHTKRFGTWQVAHDNTVGPAIFWGKFCEVQRAPWRFSVSLICMEYVEACHEKFHHKARSVDDARKIARLIARASEAGLLHADPHYSNVRCTPTDAVFIDCEDMIFAPGHAKTFEYLMLCRMLVDSHSGVEEVYRTALQAMDPSVRENASAYVRTRIKDEFVRQTYQTALFESRLKLQTKTLTEWYRAPLTARMPQD